MPDAFVATTQWRGKERMLLSAVKAALTASSCWLLLQSCWPWLLEITFGLNDSMTKSSSSGKLRISCFLGKCPKQELFTLNLVTGFSLIQCSSNPWLEAFFSGNFGVMQKLICYLNSEHLLVGDWCLDRFHKFRVRRAFQSCHKNYLIKLKFFPAEMLSLFWGSFVLFVWFGFLGGLGKSKFLFLFV